LEKFTREIRNLISSAKTDKAINRLLSLTDKTDFRDEALQQSAKFEALQREKRSGISSPQETSLELNRINLAILEIASKIDNSKDIENDIFKSKLASRKQSKLSWWTYIIGASIIIAILGGIAEVLGFLGLGGNSEKNGTANSITVLVHGKEGKDQLVLPGRGKVYLRFADAVRSEIINNNGVATFNQVPEEVFQKTEGVHLAFGDPEGEPYRSARPDSTYIPKMGQAISLEVVLEGLEELEGTVKDFVTGAPIDSVLIRIRGHSYHTNSFGEFTINIPQKRQSQFIDIRLSKEGYESKELSNVPTTTKQAQIISLKPINQ